jgi:hypothetical protein
MTKTPDFKETVSLQQYRGAIDFLQTHIQLLDASLLQTIKVLKEQTDKEKNINVVLGLNERTYNRLNHPVKQHSAIIKHSQKKNIEFAILRLFNLFTAYLQSITKEMFAKNPMLVVGKAVINKNGEDKENLTMSYAEIIRLNSFENLQEQIVLNVFRSIEELKSTSKLLDKILKDTKVNIPKSITDDALTYLEMRHLFIHNKGLVDNKYAKSYGSTFTPPLKEKKELPTKFETFNNGLIAVTKLITTIDEQLIAKGMVGKREFKEKSTTA